MTHIYIHYTNYDII